MPASREFEFAIAIHGGAGTILKENMTPEVEAEYRAKLSESLKTGYDILANGGTSLDAVVATIKIMEDSPLFNAGKGAVFNHNGLNELDASIMDGKILKAGAVGAVRNIHLPARRTDEVLVDAVIQSKDLEAPSLGIDDPVLPNSERGVVSDLLDAIAANVAGIA